MPREGDVHLGGLEKEQRERRAHPRRGAPALPPCGRTRIPAAGGQGNRSASFTRRARGPPMSFSLQSPGYTAASYKEGESQCSPSLEPGTD